MVASESLLNCYANTQEWYDSGFVDRFIALVQHDAHMTQPCFKQDNKKIIMVMAPSPTQIIDEEFVKDHGGATHFVSPAYSHSHFAVLYYDLYESTVTVFDGLNIVVRKWEPHIVQTLKVYGIKPLDVTYKSLTTTSTVKDRNNRDKITIKGYGAHLQV
jgi:hypothetical protein